jgi:hypothetical protein
LGINIHPPFVKYNYLFYSNLFFTLPDTMDIAITNSYNYSAFLGLKRSGYFRLRIYSAGIRPLYGFPVGIKFKTPKLIREFFA